MRRLRQAALAAVLAGALAGCQQTAPALMNAGVEADIVAAGFERVKAEADMVAYVCLPARCGGVVAIVRGFKDLPSDTRTALTVEDAVKSGTYNDAGVKRLLDAFLQEKHKGARLTSLRIDKRRAEVSLGIAGSDNATGRGVLAVRANTLRGLIVISSNAALVQRYFRRGWLP